MMRTSISGMNAQSNRLSAISDNVANSSTIGYKRSEARFSTLVMSENRSSYDSGSVRTSIRYSISTEGGRRTTGDTSDMSILGNGFFIVSDRKDGSGGQFLTRAGDFKPDKEGFLRNSAGFYLLDETGSPVNVGSADSSILAKPQATDNVDFKGAIPADAKAITDKDGHPVEINLEDPKTYNHKTSVTILGKKGEKIFVDVFMQKTSAGNWTAVAAIKDSKGKYQALGNVNLAFNEDGTLDVKNSNLKINVPEADGVSTQEVTIDFGGLSESGSAYSVAPLANGRGPGGYSSYSISENGEIVIKLTNGDTLSRGFINLATAPAVDLLSVKTGTVFQKNPESGELIIGRPNTGPFGSVQSQQLEESNADIASELTDMIEAQRNFTANSKVFQTGSEVMEVVVNLKR